MLRKSTRSIGSMYRRLREMPVICSLRLSSSSSLNEDGGAREYLPLGKFHCQGSPGNNSLRDWKSPSAQSSEVTTPSVQQYDNKDTHSIVNDKDFNRFGRAENGFKPISSDTTASPIIVHQDLTTTSVTPMREDNLNLHPSIFERRLVMRTGNYNNAEMHAYSTHNRWMKMGGPSNRWALGQSVRLVTSKTGATEAEDARKKSSEEGLGSKAYDENSSTVRVEDFQHEEIVGPTVERDLSDTAVQVRESMAELRSYMASFATGFVLLGAVQLVTAVWATFLTKAEFVLWRDLPLIIMSFTFAYLIRNAGSAMDFFTKMEGRSRLRILTLSLQVIKGLSHFFHRSGVLVKFVAFTSLLVLVKQGFNF